MKQYFLPSIPAPFVLGLGVNERTVRLFLGTKCEEGADSVHISDIPHAVHISLDLLLAIQKAQTLMLLGLERQ